MLLSQRLTPTRQPGSARAATLAAIEQLGYIQIDTISVVQRAHHHTLWNRNPRYDESQLDRLLSEQLVFEYWSHAAAYLPMADFRFSLPRKHALASGARSHWYARDDQMIKLVLDRIASDGAVRAKDFEHTGDCTGAWKAKPAKRALEYLFMQGDLMTPRREKFQKVYDLTERVLPTSTNTTVPSPEEYARYLVTRFLRANGFGRPAEMAYLLPDIKSQVGAVVNDMVGNGELRQFHVAGNSYYALTESLALLEKPLARRRLKILSPFDNLVIQRQRMQALFGFDYLIECYVPEAKRQYGYFSLPILWNAQLVARMDCRVERGALRLHVEHLALEATLSETDAFLSALQVELLAFLRFNHCETLRLHRVTPATLKPELERVLGALLS